MYKRITLRVIIALVLSVSSILPLVPGSAAASQDKPETKPGKYIVKFKTKTDESKARQITGKKNVKFNRHIPALSIAAIDITSDPSALEEIKKDPEVAYVEPDHIVRTSFTPSDPYYRYQWAIENTGQYIGGSAGTVDADIDANEAWDSAAGSAVRVAVLDTGVDQNHPDISSKIVAQRNFSDSATIDDNNGHGTHVAGTIAAITNNGVGVAGGCPSCSILNAKVLADDGSGYHSSLADGLIWATDNGAKVINLSLGGPASLTLQEAVSYATSKGAVVVAAAGNAGSTSKSYPAAYENVIAVAATDNKDIKASFSNYGADWVDIAAPGKYILATLPNHTNASGKTNYGYMSGTSMATPIVASAAGLVWQSPYGTSSTSVRSQLEKTADKISGTGSYWANGRVNAMSATVSEVPPAPVASDTTVPSTPTLSKSGVRFNQVKLSWTASTDNVGVTGYTIYRNGQALTTVTTLNYTDTSVQPATNYTYTVSALDAAGNQSKNSNTVSVTTQKAGSFIGKVASRSGRPVAAARLQFTSSGITTIVYTNEKGEYSTPTIQAGYYSLKVSASGYSNRYIYPQLAGYQQLLNVSL